MPADMYDGIYEPSDVDAEREFAGARNKRRRSKSRGPSRRSKRYARRSAAKKRRKSGRR